MYAYTHRARWRCRVWPECGQAADQVASASGMGMRASHPEELDQCQYRGPYIRANAYIICCKFDLSGSPGKVGNRDHNCWELSRPVQSIRAETWCRQVFFGMGVL